MNKKTIDTPLQNADVFADDNAAIGQHFDEARGVAEGVESAEYEAI